MASMKPEGSAPAVKILHHTVICCARERLWIQNPYFIPEPDAIDDRALAKRLEEIFEDDRKDCIELNADHWKRRGLLHRAQDSALYLFNEVL